MGKGVFNDKTVAYFRAFESLRGRFDAFQSEWEDFNQEYGGEDIYFKYLETKITDLEKDIDWLRKKFPKNKKQETL